MSADAYHITQPAPDGRGALLAMQRALCKSGVTASDVAYVNAHATSTPLGDAVEAAAIAKLFNFPQADAAESMLANAMEPTGHVLSTSCKQPIQMKGVIDVSKGIVLVFLSFWKGHRSNCQIPQTSRPECTVRFLSLDCNLLSKTCKIL